MMVEDFAVEGYDGIAIGAPHRLIAAFDVDNAQPCGSERDARRGETALLVRPAMYERSNAGLQYPGCKCPDMMGVTENPAHAAITSSANKMKDLPGNAAFRENVLDCPGFASVVGQLYPAFL